MPRKDAGTGPISAQAQQDLVSEGIENFELPKSIITKIAKSVLPENTKLQKDTILSLIKGSTVFINYLAATAHDVAIQKQHKSISASDVLKALEIIEFGDLAEMFQVELQAYRDLAKSDKDTVKPKAAPAKKTAADGQSASTASASTKSKGKEKAKDAFTSAPLRTNPYPSISAPPEPDMDIDQDEEVVEAEVDEEEPEDYTEDEEETEEEPEDRMAVEEEEMRADARGVEERSVIDAD